ncbi:MAG: HAMP domain-containing histidine kinase [Rhodospirillales bacterium]|nr:HAMP domain-containing histidine kinase [Rhodospirillales bacterium]
MSLSASTAERAVQPPSSEAAKTTTRGGLVSPVIVIISISLLVTCGLVWSSAQLLNRNAEATTQHLARSMLANNTQALRSLAVDSAWADTPYRRLVERFDPRWADRKIGGYLAAAHGISASMVIAADDRTIVAYLGGERARLDAYQYIPNGLRILVDQARKGPMAKPDAVSGLTRIGDQVHLVVVSPLSARTPAARPQRPGPRPVLVLAQALNGEFLGRSGRAFALDGLDFVSGKPPRNYFSVILTGIDGGRLGSLVWRGPRPGDGLLIWLMPSLASALSAVTYLLYLFFRSTDLVLERQAHLMSSLRRERELRNLKSRFVTMVSHELRTPLATIRSAVDLLDRYEERMTAEERRQELGAVRTAVGGLTKMVEDVLALGRFDAAAKSNETRLSLEHFAQEIWDEAVRAQGTRHRLELGGTALDRNIMIDEAFLRVVLSNLFQNAIKYSPDSGVVALEIAGEKTDCIIKVTDFGRGIPAEEHDKIFEAFHRGTSAASTSGAGLGLAVAKAAAERLGGSLGVESVAGEGSTFELVLPGRLKARPSLRRKEDT